MAAVVLEICDLAHVQIQILSWAGGSGHLKFLER